MSDALQTAVQLMQAKRFSEAELSLRGWLAHNPDDVEARHLRAMALGHLAKFDAGRAEFMALVDVHPQPHAVLSNLGNLERRSGNPGAAVDAYRAALKRQPDFVNARFSLANALAEMSLHDEAVAEFERIIEAQNAHIGALNGLGNALVSLGRDDDALAAFDTALELRPDAVICRVNRGALLRSMGRMAAAIADLQRACREAPQLAEAHYQLGNTLRANGQNDGARQSFDAALRYAPDRVDIHRDMASLAWETGAGAQATRTMDDELAQRPNADLALAKAEILLRSGDLEGARTAAHQALHIDPNHARALALRGELKAQFDGAISGVDDLKAAFEASGGQDCAIRHQLVESLLAQRAFDQALALLDEEPDAKYLQKHVALKALAWRGLDDPAYRQFYDYDRFTWVGTIETPPGYDDLDAFNHALAESIARLHTTSAQPLDQTLFGGTQSPGRLWNEDDPVIKALSSSLLGAARTFISELPDDSGHPFLRRNTGKIELAGAWSVRLRSGGGHVDHVHPAGWISACYYVEVPQTVIQGKNAGWLRLGASGVRGLDMAAERYIRPEPGRVIFFPSYMWHGVEPFESETMRVTAPFDLIPA